MYEFTAMFLFYDMMSFIARTQQHTFSTISRDLLTLREHRGYLSPSFWLSWCNVQGVNTWTNLEKHYLSLFPLPCWPFMSIENFHVGGIRTADLWWQKGPLYQRATTALESLNCTLQQPEAWTLLSFLQCRKNSMFTPTTCNLKPLCDFNFFFSPNKIRDIAALKRLCYKRTKVHFTDKLR